MLFHFTPPLPAFMRPVLLPVIGNAFTFVSFFFLISGFILTYNYADRATLSPRNFYIARVSRVYPVYLLVMLLSIPFLQLEWQARSHQDFWAGLILTPFALQGWSPTLSTFWNTVAWTIPAEVALYLVFPYLLRLLQSQAVRLATPARLIALFLALWVIGFLPHIVYLALNPDHFAGAIDRYSDAYWLRALKFTPPAYFCTFTAGMVLARLHATLRLKPMHRAVVGLAGILALALYLAVAVPFVPYVLVHGSLLLPIYATILIGVAGANPVASVFAFRPLVLLGETTFALYLLHFNGIQFIQNHHLTERLHLAAFDPWISFAAIILLAILVTFLYERPARNFVLARFGK